MFEVAGIEQTVNRSEVLNGEGSLGCVDVGVAVAVVEPCLTFHEHATTREVCSPQLSGVVTEGRDKTGRVVIL